MTDVYNGFQTKKDEPVGSSFYPNPKLSYYFCRAAQASILCSSTSSGITPSFSNSS